VIGDDIGAGDLVVNRAQTQRRHRQRRQPHDGLANAWPGTVYRHHPLPHDHPAEGAAGEAPAGHVVDRNEPDQGRHAPTAPARGGQCGANAEVDGRGGDSRGRGGWKPRCGSPPTHAQQMQSDHEVVDGELRDRVQKEGEAGLVTVNRRHQPAAQDFDPQVAPGSAHGQPAFDRPLNPASGHTGATEAEEFERAEKEGVDACAHESKRQRRDVR
jgi:hypothetical protein